MIYNLRLFGLSSFEKQAFTAQMMLRFAIIGLTAVAPLLNASAQTPLEGRWIYVESRQIVDDSIVPMRTSPAHTLDFSSTNKWSTRNMNSSSEGSYALSKEMKLEQTVIRDSLPTQVIRRDVRFVDGRMQLTQRLEGEELQKALRAPASAQLPALIFLTHVYRRDDASEEQLASKPTTQNSLIPTNSVTVRIGLAAPMSGNLWHLGRDLEEGARLAIEELNANQTMIGNRRAFFELIVEDDKDDKNVDLAAKTTANKLIAKDIHAVVGHFSSGRSIPAAPVYAKAGIPQISPSSANPRYTQLGLSTAFRIVPHDSATSEVLGSYMALHESGRTALVISDGTFYGDIAAKGFERGFSNAGGAILARVQYSANRKSFATILRQAQTTQPTTIFFGGMDTDADFVIQMLEETYTRASFSGGDGICHPDFRQGKAASSISVHCTESGALNIELPQVRDYLWRFHEKYGRNHVFFSAFAYDAVYVIARAMQDAKSFLPKDYLSYLRSTNFDGITGNIQFDSKGDIVSGGTTVYTYVEGKRVLANRFSSGDTFQQKSK